MKDHTILICNVLLIDRKRRKLRFPLKNVHLGGKKSWVYRIANIRLLLFPAYLERGRDVEGGVHPAEGVEDVVLDAGAHVLILIFFKIK